MSQLATAQVSEEELKSIQTPDTVETSIGTLKFFDGVPTAETAERVYDNLDRMRGVDAFLKGMPGASVKALMDGPRSIGAKEPHQVVIMDKLMDSTSMDADGDGLVNRVELALNMDPTSADGYRDGMADGW